MLWSDGRGSVFAPVAARRQKEIKRGIDTYAKHVCRRRRDGSQSIPLFVLFVLFGQAKRTLKEKKHQRNFSFIVLFCEEKYQKSARRTCAVLLPNHRGVHELVARAMRGKCVRQRAERKSAVSRYPQFQLYHACEHSARKSRADSCTHCLHAR